MPFAPDVVEGTEEAMYTAQDTSTGPGPRAGGSDAAAADDADALAATETIAECDAKLGRYRAALVAGANPAVVAGWMAEVQGVRAGAELRIRRRAKRERMTREQVTALRVNTEVNLGAQPAGDGSCPRPDTTTTPTRPTSRFASTSRN